VIARFFMHQTLSLTKKNLTRTGYRKRAKI
jgi:hypothetical protein